jgi:hypothetical protein
VTLSASLGSLQGGDTVHLIVYKGDLLKSLDTFLKTKKTRLRDLFDRIDVDRSGTLETAELTQLVKMMVPDASAVDTLFFQVAMDADANGKVRPSPGDSLYTVPPPPPPVDCVNRLA